MIYSTAKQCLLTQILCLVLCLSSAPCSLADETLPIKLVVTKETVAVAHIDVRAIKIPKLIQWSVDHGLMTAEQVKEMQMVSVMGQGIIGGLEDAGVERLFVTFRVSDIQKQNPIWCATVAQGKDVNEARQAIESVLGMLPGGSRVPSRTIGVKGRLIVGAENQEVLDEIIASPSVVRADFDSAWADASKHDAGLIITGTADIRRVVREMLPTFPAPFQDVSAVHFADNTQWAQITLDLPPNENARVTVQHVDTESAERTKRLIETTVAYSNDVASSEFKEQIGNLMTENITPTVQQRHVEIDLKWVLEQKPISMITFNFRNSSANSQRGNNMRQIMLALLNYESAHASFPPAAICSDDGVPLLSWRVAILPFLDQDELYKQFHLDEPWDSPHNLRLARQMPEAFADPSTEFNHLRVNGLTMIQAPYGDEVFFSGTDGTKFKNISDGSSNTIAIVTVASENAVRWTEPKDWQVDLESPWSGLAEGEGETTVGFADGSVYKLSRQSTDAQKLRAWLTSVGGEVVEK